MVPAARLRGEHAVQFYDSDTDLAASVVPYLAAGARDGEALVLIADDAHRRAFEEGLRDAGLDIAEARAAEKLISLDAATVLSALMPAGRLDAEAFEEVVGGLLRRAAGRARGIRAYGEMVALLWAAGDVQGAIELERLWNKLAQKIEFSLFCAYPSASFESAHERAALQEVCDLHSAIVPAAGSTGACRESVQLAPELESCARARLFVRSTLRRYGHTGYAVDDASVVSSELATNAVIHARTRFTVELQLDGDALRVEVSDGAPARWVPLEVPPKHGLSIVGALCNRWGIAASEEGKTVWAELSLGAGDAASGT